jgi:hypothetical protein
VNPAWWCATFIHNWNICCSTHPGNHSCTHGVASVLYCPLICYSFVHQFPDLHYFSHRFSVSLANFVQLVHNERTKIFLTFHQVTNMILFMSSFCSFLPSEYLMGYTYILLRQLSESLIPTFAWASLDHPTSSPSVDSS